VKVGSLFSGVGGFDLGLESAGHEVVWQVEFDKQCRSVLRRHWPKAQLHEDVNDVGSDELARVDLICGGFPCQDLSVAGKREGLAGERSGLWWQFHRIIGELTPRWVLIENVPGLLSSNEGRDMRVVTRGLEEHGYGWTYRVLDSQYFGVAQRRRRVFIVGHLGSFCPPEVLLEPESLPWHPAPSRTAGKDAPNAAVSSSLQARDWKGIGGQDDQKIAVAHALGKSLEGSAGIGDSGDPMYTLQAGQQHGIAHPITAREGKGPNSDCDSGNLIADTLRVGGRDQGAGDGPDNTPLVADTLRGHPRPGSNSLGALAFHHKASAHQSMNPSEVSPALGVTKEPAVFDPVSPTGHQGDTCVDPEGASIALCAGGGNNGGGGGQILGQTIPRRLTPRECERLQGFPEIKETAIFQVWNWPDRQAARVNAGHPCPKSPSSAAPVATERLQPDARLAEPHSPTSHLGPEPPVVADVHIDCERNGVEIHSHGKLIWSASDAGTQSESPLPMGHAGFVRLAVGTMRTLERGTTTGGAGSQPKRGLSSPLRSGGIRADVCGREIAALASDADLLTEAVSGLSRSTTSEAGESSPTSAQTWAIFCSCVVRAISGFTPDATPTGSSFSFALTLHSGWTRYADDGTELADGPRYRMMGNAVTVSVAEWIGRRLKETE